MEGRAGKGGGWGLVGWMRGGGGDEVGVFCFF